MSDDMVSALRDMATDQARHRTHYEGCGQTHLECAALHAADEIEHLRDEIERHRQALRLAAGEWWGHG